MRFYADFKEAKSEIKRDLAEMGTIIHTKTMQDKEISDDKGFATRELTNYIYTVTNYTLLGLNPSQPWADREFNERMQGISGDPVNPGDAWRSRKEIWEEFLEDDGRFSYTYGERFKQGNQFDNIKARLREDPLSRQLYASMWHPHDDSYNFGTHRVPCSLGWLFQVRDEKLNVTYFMRSCDMFTHYDNDCYLTLRLRDRIAEWVDIPPGTFTHYIGSLHVYQKDVEEVF